MLLREQRRVRLAHQFGRGHQAHGLIALAAHDDRAAHGADSVIVVGRGRDRRGVAVGRAVRRGRERERARAALGLVDASRRGLLDEREPDRPRRRLAGRGRRDDAVECDAVSERL